jgi:hypothetical protein
MLEGLRRPTATQARPLNAGDSIMARRLKDRKEQARAQSREDQSRRPGENRQDFGNREFQRGTQRNENQIEGGQRRDDGGSIAPGKRRSSRH